MTDKLPPNLLALFAARPPLRWLEAPDYAPEKRVTPKIDGIAAFLPQLKQALETDDGYVPSESWLDARDRKKREKKEALQNLVKEGPASCMADFYPPRSNTTWLIHSSQSNQTKIPTFEAMLSGP
jgi:U1 small nuclear ribonucleoprotein 70kDa